MTQVAKLIEKLQTQPADIAWVDLVRILKHFDFEPLKTGKTGGSRRKFFRRKSGTPIFLHEPHPSNIVKRCYIRQVVETLYQLKLINKHDEKNTNL